MFAVMRIGMALMTIQCFWNVRPYWRMFYSDEGFFSLSDARNRLGSAALAGWTPEDGFLDAWAYLKFFSAKHSAFLLDASPEFVNTYMFAFFGVLILYALGVLSRVTGVVAWLMMSGIYNHNSVYLEGTDTVYRCFWFILLFCRTGAAWSVDNVVRCWWLRRRGKLQAPDATAATPGLAPVYRLVPSWPRYLMMGQLIAIYTCTGLVKTGSVWRRGDAFYYSVNLDHFYRFEGWTQVVSASLATSVFRVMSWVTWWWESCFAVVGLGMILKFALDHQGQPWYRAQQVWWRLWPGRVALLGAYFTLYYIAILAAPYCVEMPKKVTPAAAEALVASTKISLHSGFGVVIPGCVLVWFLLGRWPLRRGRFVVEQASLRRWILGRRVWLTLGLMFHGCLILFMNIGMFPFIMLMVYAAWLTGEEFAAALRGFVTRLQRGPLGRRLPATWWARAGQWTAPAQAAEAVPPRGRVWPDWLVILFAMALLGLIGWRISGQRELGTYVYTWIATVLAVGLVFRLLRPRPLNGAPALAYGPAGRALALGAVVWHGSAVGLGLGPNYSIFANWRGPARAIFGSWQSMTGTAQSWKMFAPNPPRANVFMKTVVVDANGTRWNIGNNSYDFRPNPWIWNDRMRKMNRRMVGKAKWYLRYWSNYQCREWYLETGERAASVEIHKIVTRIPTPEQVTTKGYYNPRELKATDELIETHTCPLGGDLPPFMKLRRGIPLSDSEQAQLDNQAEQDRRNSETKRKAWENRRDWRWSKPESPTSNRPGTTGKSVQHQQPPTSPARPTPARPTSRPTSQPTPGSAPPPAPPTPEPAAVDEDLHGNDGGDGE